MRFLLMNHLQNASQSLRTNRSRSALTMLGVTIGVASVTAILALSGGASRIVNDQIDELDGNIIVVRPGTPKSPILNITQPSPNFDYAASTLSEYDVSQIYQIPHVKSVAPLMILSGSIKGDTTAPNTSMIVATTPQLAQISNINVRMGQFINDALDQNTTVIGKDLAIDIFGTDQVLGRTLMLRNKPFIVVGLLSKINKPINYNSVDLDHAALVNFDTGKILNFGLAQIQQIDIQADSKDNLEKLVKTLNNKIQINHDGEHDFAVLINEQISQPTSNFFFTITGVTTAIAAISLVVGGIGIMNIMLVTVAERTREIGIRKALGASNRDILWQFLIESLAISVVGGVIGYIAGYLIAIGVGAYLNFNPAVNWQIAFISLSISIVLGTLFGLYPAIRAATKDPIESLNRHN